jgi:hypothetical protein
VWWVSFAIEEGPLGVVITPDEEDGDVIALHRRLWTQGLNPGGEMLAGIAPREAFAEHEPWSVEPENQNRLIDVDELERRGVDSLFLGGRDG